MHDRYQFCPFMPYILLNEYRAAVSLPQDPTSLSHFHGRSSRQNYYNVQSVDILSKIVIAHVLRFDNSQVDLSPLCYQSLRHSDGTHNTLISTDSLPTDLLPWGRFGGVVVLVGELY